MPPNPTEATSAELQPGSLVTVDFPGANQVKRRPAVVISSETYHETRPDAIIGLITSRVQSAKATTDYVLADWEAAGLKRPSAFRAFLVTVPRANVRVIGQLSERDWLEVQSRVRRALSGFDDGD